MNAKTVKRIIGSLLVAASGFALTAAHAIDLSAISNQDASAGLKEALNKGSAAAVAKLGVQNGFLNNPKVKIPLPDGLKQAEKAMKLLGKQKQFDDLVVSMNRAAEAAVPEAKVLLLDAVKGMSVQDAKGIIGGGDDSVTKFFQGKTQDKLALRFLPIVKKATDNVGLAQQYNNLAGQAASFGVVKQQDAKIENYVTRKAMDGLFLMIAEEERAIRKDPVRAGSEILRRVFGS
jgi:Protein of unknown function (DUF4197)